jgi:hypothetical protein
MGSGAGAIALVVGGRVDLTANSANSRELPLRAIQKGAMAVDCFLA